MKYALAVVAVALLAGALSFFLLLGDSPSKSSESATAQPSAAPAAPVKPGDEGLKGFKIP